MSFTKVELKRNFGPVAALIAAVFLLSGCETLFGASEKRAELEATEDSGAMRAECMAMHEAMNAKMAEGGMEMKEEMMSPEMKAKHEQCMAMMSEMRETCMRMEEGQMKGQEEGMSSQCKAMMHGPTEHEHKGGEEQ